MSQLFYDEMADDTIEPESKSISDRRPDYPVSKYVVLGNPNSPVEYVQESSKPTAQVEQLDDNLFAQRWWFVNDPIKPTLKSRLIQREFGKTYSEYEV